MTTNIENILIISDEPWGDQWFSKHHYAYELALLGYQSYFIQPPKKWKVTNIFKKISVKKEKGVLVTECPNYLPIFNTTLLTKLNDIINRGRFKRRGIINEKALIWNFSPNRFGIRYPKMIYHIADPYYETPYNNAISSNSDLVVCTSEYFMKYYEQFNSIFIPHGISSEEFSFDLSKVKELKNEFSDYSILIGSFSNNVNLSLIEKIASNNPNVNLLLLGRIVEIDEVKWQALINLNNVHYLGIIKAKQLKNYIAGAKFALTIYNFDYSIKNSSGAGSSLKNMIYLAQFKPVISTLSNDIDQFNNLGLYSGIDSEEILDLVSKAVEGKLLVDQVTIKRELDKLSYKSLIQKTLANLDKRN